MSVRIEGQAAEQVKRLQALADADTEVFSQVTAAYRLPREDEAQRAARSAAIQQALVAAARVPLDTARASTDVLAIAEEAAPLLNASVISDVLVGALLAHAALESAALNVEINLGGMSDAEQAAQLEAELQAAQAGAAQRLERTLAAGRSRFPSRKR